MAIIRLCAAKSAVNSGVTRKLSSPSSVKIADRLGAADDAHEVDLEQRQTGRMHAVFFGDQDRQAVLLGQALDARRDVHRIPDRRIAEALLRAEIADAAGAGVQADADLDRLRPRVLFSSSSAFSMASAARQARRG